MTNLSWVSRLMTKGQSQRMSKEQWSCWPNWEKDMPVIADSFWSNSIRPGVKGPFTLVRRNLSQSFFAPSLRSHYLSSQAISFYPHCIYLFLKKTQQHKRL